MESERESILLKKFTKTKDYSRRMYWLFGLLETLTAWYFVIPTILLRLGKEDSSLNQESGGLSPYMDNFRDGLFYSSLNGE